MIESVPLPIVVKDAHDLTYVLTNRAAEEQFGMTRAKVLGKTVHDLLPKPEADVIEQRDREMVAGEPRCSGRKPTKTPPRNTLHASLRVPIRDEASKPRYILGIMEDVTERKQRRTSCAAPAGSSTPSSRTCRPC